jgi:DNA ligase-4
MMPFPFRLLCDLLNKLDWARTKRASSKANTDTTYARITTAWLEKHRQIIPRAGPEVVAFLSCVFPERRPDRVYELQEKRLEPIIQQAQCLGATRLEILRNWRTTVIFTISSTLTFTARTRGLLGVLLSSGLRSMESCDLPSLP